MFRRPEMEDFTRNEGGAAPGEGDIAASPALPTEPVSVTEPSAEELRQKMIDENRGIIERISDSFTKFKKQPERSKAKLYDWQTWVTNEDLDEGATIVSGTEYGVHTLREFPYSFLRNARPNMQYLDKLKKVFPDDYEMIEDSLYLHLQNLVVSQVSPPITGPSFIRYYDDESGPPEDIKWRDEMYAYLEPRVKAREEKKLSGEREYARGWLRGWFRNMDGFLALNKEKFQLLKQGKSYLKEYLAEHSTYVKEEGISQEERERRIEKFPHDFTEVFVPIYLNRSGYSFDDNFVIDFLARLTKDEARTVMEAWVKMKEGA